jgi:hypothetical protein
VAKKAAIDFATSVNRSPVTDMMMTKRILIATSNSGKLRDFAGAAFRQFLDWTALENRAAR